MCEFQFPKRRKTSQEEQCLLFENKSNWDHERILKWKSNICQKTKKLKKPPFIHKKKLKTSQQELEILQNYHYPSKKEINDLSHLLQWKRRRVVQWFTNKNKCLL